MDQVRMVQKEIQARRHGTLKILNYFNEIL